jgi:hypothetical protein
MNQCDAEKLAECISVLIDVALISASTASQANASMSLEQTGREAGYLQGVTDASCAHLFVTSVGAGSAIRKTRPA